MKKILMILTLFCAINCKSASELQQQRVDSCSKVCKANPEISELSHEEGGGLIIFGGYTKEKCTCTRQGKGNG